jgi:hypothetical protein
MKKLVRKYGLLTVVVLITFIFGIIGGLAMAEFEFFPYHLIKGLVDSIKWYDRSIDLWSIGIYQGETPFQLSPMDGVTNPILTSADISDIPPTYVGDPFMVMKDDTYYLFFEVVNKKTGQGDIAFATSQNLKEWDYQKVIIDESFHLSFPYVFEYAGSYYLIPESSNDFSVRLYKAVSFPDKWEYQGNILSGNHYSDPSIIRYHGKWWLFVSNPYHDGLTIYYSDDLLLGWTPHPMNPVVKGNKHISRPGGKMLIYQDALYRFAQDDDPTYGRQVFAFKITELSETSYREEPVPENPIVKFSGQGWNATGMHTVDLHLVGEKWVALVDGKRR